MTKPITPTETPENIESPLIINGQEYDPQEAQSLIDLGKKTKELETQWDTPVDKVWPEYGKTREEIKTVQIERDQARAELEEFKRKQVANVETPADIQEAKEAARKLGLVLNEDFEKGGYIKKDELPQLFATYQQEVDAARQVLDAGKKLETEIDGKDGRPKFNTKAVIAYAGAYNIPDLMQAYEDMYKPELDSWKATQIESKRAGGMRTLGASGAKKVPDRVKITDDNVSELLKEHMGGSSEE